MRPRFQVFRFGALLACVVLVGAAAWAHEPYLLLTANDDGTFTAEAGFSDGVNVAGLTLLLRERATGATIAEHVLPEGGKLTLPIPAVPYRVTFDGGPGHKLTKIGPDASAGAVAPSATGAPEPASPPPGTEAVSSPSDSWRLTTLITLVFLLAIGSFALGYAAGGRERASR